MIEQGNRTEQLIYRTSYRKHRERLAGIRHNVTGNDFMPPKHQSAKKSQHKDRAKREEIESNNNYLKGRIAAIKHRNNGIEELYSTEQLRREPRRYIDDSGEARIEVTSELNEGEQYRFVLPSGKPPSYSYHVKGKEGKAENALQSKGNSIDKCYKKYTSNSVLKDSQKDLKPNKQKDILYNLPERNENRVVIYKKTLILSSMQSCMLELSLINERLLIAAYMMGLENVTLRQLFSLKRSTDMMKEYQGNYDDLCGRIVIEKVGDKYQSIRIIAKEDNKEKSVAEEDKAKQKVKIQNDFIKRNYYTLAKSEDESKLEGQKEKSGPSFEHVQAIVDRLAVPKRFYKFKEEKIDKTEKPRVASNYQRQPKEQVPAPNNRRSLEKSKESEVSLPKNKDSNINISQKKAEDLKKSLPLKQKQPQKQQKQEEQNYEQQFDNPSQLKNDNHSLEKSKLKESAPSPKALKQSVKISHKNESEVYDNDFENQPEKVQQEQQQYEEEFQESNMHSPAPKKESVPATPIDGVEQEYEDEFV